MIKATIYIDDDRWAKRPFRVEFDNPECNKRFGGTDHISYQSCLDDIKRAKTTGYDIDLPANEKHY